MLLKYKLDPKSNIVYITHSSKQDRLTRDKCKFTEAFLNIHYSDRMKPSVIVNSGDIPLHRIIQQVRALPGYDYVVWLTPGFCPYYEYIETIHTLVDNLSKDPKGWGMIKGEHICILNPINNDCYQGDNPDEWAAKCKTNNLTVEEYDFGGTGHEEFGKLKEARKEFLKWADSSNDMDDNIGKYNEPILQMTGAVVDDITAWPSDTLIHFSKQTIKEATKQKYKEVISFDTIEELEELMFKHQSNTTWVIGIKLVTAETWWRYGWKKVAFLSSALMSFKDTVVFGELIGEDGVVHSTYGDSSIV
jgi:hypothetical protein